MSFKQLAKKLIQEGYEKGGKLIEMGEFDPMYPEAPVDPVQAAEEIPVSMVSMDAELLKELLLWAGQEDSVAQNVVDKAVQLSSIGSLGLDHLMDLTGAADYEQPMPTMCPQATGVVSPVIPSGPVSPVMASYQRRASAIVESIERAKNISQDARAIKYKLKKLSESDRNYLRDYLGEEEDEDVEDTEVDTDVETLDDVDSEINSEVDDTLSVEPEEEIESGPSKTEIKDELEDIDFASNTLQGAVDGAAEVVSEVGPDTLNNIDASILDGDEDGQTINQQIADIKAKIDFIAHEIGLDDHIEPDTGISNIVADPEVDQEAVVEPEIEPELDTTIATDVEDDIMEPEIDDIVVPDAEDGEEVADIEDSAEEDAEDLVDVEVAPEEEPL